VKGTPIHKQQSSKATPASAKKPVGVRGGTPARAPVPAIAKQPKALTNCVKKSVGGANPSACSNMKKTVQATVKEIVIIDDNNEKDTKMEVSRFTLDQLHS